MSDKPNYDQTGILFENDKEGNDQRPDFKGNITVNGTEWDLAAWRRSGKKGSFLTLKVSEKRRQDVSGQVSTKGAPQNAHRAQQRPQGRDTDMQSHGSMDDSDLPPF